MLASCLQDVSCAASRKSPLPRRHFQGDEGTSVKGLLETLNSLPVRGFNLPLPASDSISELLSHPSVPEAHGDLPRCQYAEDRWVHPHGNRYRLRTLDFVIYYVHQRIPNPNYAEYEQSPSYSKDDQPSSTQQQVQETIPNRLIRTWRPREDHLDSGLLEQTPCRQRKQILPASASDLFPASPHDHEREESEVEE
ncbi:hypothetical protein Efla_005277 [Eimeria flavescens]